MSVAKPQQYIFLSLSAVVAAILALLGLLPIAGGLPAIASPAIFSADAIWFTANLAGPLLLLAAGLRILFRKLSQVSFVCGYTILLAIGGDLRLWLTGFHRMAIGWLVMSICIGLLLLVLRRLWLWALIGGLWSGLLLGFWSYGGLIGYASNPTSHFTMLFPIQVAGCLSAFVIGFLFLRFRRTEQPSRGSETSL